MDIGSKIAQARRELGITQIELADRMCVTRQTISRWETGAALPDIEKVADLAEILQVSCDYLLKEHFPETNAMPPADKNNATDTAITSLANEDNAWNENNSLKSKSTVTKLLSDIVGKRVRITFYEEEEDYDLFDQICIIDSFKGNWICLTIPQNQNSEQKKLVALSSVLSFEIIDSED